MSPIPRRSNLGQHWNLQESTIFLNHGSFGACPHEILEHQNKLREDLESDPVNFFDVKAKKLWAEAIEIFSDFINADKGGLVFVPNATSGVNTVLRSLNLQDGDEIQIAIKPKIIELNLKARNEINKNRQRTNTVNISLNLTGKAAEAK